MATNEKGADREYFERQIAQITNDYSRAQVERLKELLAASREREDRATDVLIKIGQIACPEQLEEMQRRNPGRPLNQYPPEDLERLISMATRMMRSAVNDMSIDENTALSAMQEEIAKLQVNLRIESHRANDSQYRLVQAQKRITELERGAGKKKQTKDSTLEAEVVSGIRWQERGADLVNGQGDLQNAGVREALGRQEKIQEPAQESIDTVATSGGITKRTKLDLTVRELESSLLAWETFCHPLPSQVREEYEYLIDLIGGSGETVGVILKKTAEMERGIKDSTCDNRFKSMVEQQIVTRGESSLGDPSKAGRRRATFTLTPYGQSIYWARHRKESLVSREDQIIAHDKRGPHGALVNRVARALNRMKYEIILDPKPIRVSDKSFTYPDIVVVIDGADEYRIEVEEKGHIAREKRTVLCTKWRNACDAFEEGNIFVVTETPQDMKKIRSSVMYMVLNDDRMPTLYLSNAEYLDSAPEGAQIWLEVLTLSPEGRQKPDEMTG